MMFRLGKLAGLVATDGLFERRREQAHTRSPAANQLCHIVR